jgi:hypothetical protein
MKLTYLRFVPFVLPLLAACGSVQTESDELTAACKSLFENRVAYEKSCLAYDPRPQDEQANVDSCVGVATAPGSLLQPADIAACANELGKLTCAQDGSYPACAGYGADLLYPNHDKKGAGLPGDGCVAQLQCDSGYCGSFGQDCGQCQSARALFESCTGPFDTCMDGDCIDGVCQLFGKKAGEACIDYGGGDCQETLFCKPTVASEIDGVCVALGETGAPCDNATECTEGHFCKDQVCTAKAADGASCKEYEGCVHLCIDGVCAKMKVGLEENEDCSSGVCGSGLTCEDNVCKPPVYLPKGSACGSGSSGSGIPCAPEQRCNLGCLPGPCATSGVCVDLPKPGEPCMDFLCGPESICTDFNPSEGRYGVCTKRGVEGEPCPCSEALACVAGKCIPFGAAVCE